MLTDGLADPAFGEIRAIYAKLLREHRHRLSDRAFEVGVARADPDSDELRILYEGVDPYLGMRFRAHGISKSHPLENLLNLLKHGIDPSRTFHSAPFALPSEYAELMAGLETATGTAYRDGIALLVGWPDKPIETGFAVVFLNDAYHPLLEPLRKAFPNTRIEPLSREKPVLEELSRKAMGK